MCLATPGRVEEIAIENDLRMGGLNCDGEIERVWLEYVPEVQVGDHTIVHVQFAISKIDSEAAQKTLGTFCSEGTCAAYFNDGRFLSVKELATVGAGLKGAAKCLIQPGTSAIFHVSNPGAWSTRRFPEH